MISWATYKQAALEYSKLRPRVVSATLTPTVNQKLQALPADCILMRYVAWGEEVPAQEAYLDVSETQMWATEPGQLILTPAPTDTTPIAILYWAKHVPVELSQTIPTIPAEDLPYVDDLELAISLSAEADDMAKGPIKYVIGQTEVDRTKAIEDLRKRADSLRTKVVQHFEQPLGLWR